MSKLKARLRRDRILDEYRQKFHSTPKRVKANENQEDGDLAYLTSLYNCQADNAENDDYYYDDNENSESNDNDPDNNRVQLFGQFD
jgi:hypothetical protein